MGFDELGAIQRAEQMKQAQAHASGKLKLKRVVSKNGNIILGVSIVLSPFTLGLSSIIGLSILTYYYFNPRKVCVKNIATGEKFFISKDDWIQYKNEDQQKQNETVNIFDKEENNKYQLSSDVKPKNEPAMTNKTFLVETADNKEIIIPKEVDNSNEESNTKKVIIHSIVVGMKFEGRQKKLKALINRLKKEDYYYDLYDDLKNKEIIEDYFFHNEDDPIWELSEEFLPYVTIQPEPDNKFDSNAVTVLVGENKEDAFVIGYLPSEDALRIQDLINNGKLSDADAKIKGGKYKYPGTDDSGDDIVFTGTSDYMIDLTLYFEK